MTTTSSVAVGRACGRALVAGALLAALPLLSSCVSAVDDTSAFGFATASASQPPAASPASGDGKPAGEGDTSESTSDAIAAAAADSTKVADVAGVAAPADAQSSGAASAPERQAETQTLRDRMTNARPVAAYAGGTVSEGDTSGETAERQAGEKSLFASLFAREAAKTPIRNADKSKSRRIVLKRDESTRETGGGLADLPGVNPSSLFEIGQRASADEVDAIDDMMSSYKVASLGAFSRLAPNGLSVARDDVQTSCFPADLVAQLRAVENRFGAKAVITSGYRSPSHNARVKGAQRSQHMGCKAADLIVPGADPLKVAAFVRALPGRGGVGTYCHTQAIHIDVGPKRDWNWRCRRR